MLVAAVNSPRRRSGSKILIHYPSQGGDPDEALKALEEESYDLVLMDVQMPEIDGVEATAKIREMEKLTGRHQLVVALTAHAMKGDVERCLSAGMDDYLSKPIRVQELDDLLDKYVSNEERIRSPKNRDSGRSCAARELFSES